MGFTRFGIGAVTSRREHKQQRPSEGDKEKQDAQSFEMDSKLVVKRKPAARLKWLEKALLFADKGYLKPSELYDVLMHPRFVSGVPHGCGSQMKELVLSKLTLFSPKQSRALQTESKLITFESSGGQEDSRGDQEAGSDCESSDGTLHDCATASSSKATAGEIDVAGAQRRNGSDGVDSTVGERAAESVARNCTSTTDNGDREEKRRRTEDGDSADRDRPPPSTLRPRAKVRAPSLAMLETLG